MTTIRICFSPLTGIKALAARTASGSIQFMPCFSPLAGIKALAADYWQCHGCQKLKFQSLSRD